MDETMTVAVSLNYLGRGTVVNLVESFYGRYYMRESNGYQIMVIRRVTLSEFVNLMQFVSSDMNYLHILWKGAEAENKRHPFPDEDVFITSRGTLR